MHPARGATFRLEGAPANGNAAPTANRDGADHRKNKKPLGSASTSNRYEQRSASSTGKKPGPRKNRQKQTVDDRFADETPKQQAQHREIARRYSWDNRDKSDRRRPNVRLNKRMRELEAVLTVRHRGRRLSEDDSGNEDLFIAAHHVAQFGDPHQHISAWARDWAPWLSDAACAALIDRVIQKPRKWSAKTLGRAMRLTQEERKRLGITTIRAFDVTDEDMKANRVASESDRHRKRRRKAGAVDRAEWLEINSAARNKPWEAQGISRATYYRRLKVPLRETETGPHAAEYKILLRADVSHVYSGNVPGIDASGPTFGSGIVFGGRGERPAAANTVIDLPTSTKTGFDDEEDRLCINRASTGKRPGSVDRGERS